MDRGEKRGHQSGSNKMIMVPPCRDCKDKDLPKNGMYLKGGKRNPCHYTQCFKPAQYADWVASLFLVPPTQSDYNRYTTVSIPEEAEEA